MNMKKTLLTLLIAGLGCSLSVNAQQGPRCQGSSCQRGQRPEGHGKHHQHQARPVWRDVEGKPDLIEVHENNQWVQYKKGTKNCPPMAHGHHGQWQGHQHHHEHRQAQGQGQQNAHRHGQAHRAHQSQRHVKYQRNDKHEKIDGVMNVWEQGACWEYVRTSNTSSVSAQDQELIIKMQEDLEID